MANKLNISGIVSGANAVLLAAKEFAPVAAQLGGPIVANAATVVIATAAMLENALERGKDASVVMTTQDEDKIAAMLAELGEVNDTLAGQVAKS